MTIPLQFADRLAVRIAGELTPFCDRVEIAGSIRRRRPMVGDIDLVVLPKPGRLDALRDRCKQNAFVRTDGEQNLIVELKVGRAACPTSEGIIQVDIFIAQPETSDLLETKPTNFGSLMICRTGSVAHNIYLVEHAKRLGLVWNPYFGVFGSRRAGFTKPECLASATEDEIFAALKLPFIKPEDRER